MLNIVESKIKNLFKIKENERKRIFNQKSIQVKYEQIINLIFMCVD